jgi:hypothetical protein
LNKSCAQTNARSLLRSISRVGIARLVVAVTAELSGDRRNAPI